MTANPDLPYALTGDFNVAMRDEDVWDISLFTDSTHVTSAERKALSDVQSVGLDDVMPRALKGRAVHILGLPQRGFPPGLGNAHRSRSSATTRSPAPSVMHTLIARRAKARVPPTTRPSSWISILPDLRKGPNL